MKVKCLDIENGDMHIQCPHCGSTESHLIDEQRDHLQNFVITHEDDKMESAVLECHICGESFIQIYSESGFHKIPNDFLTL